MTIAGNVNRWFYALFCAFAIWMLYLRSVGERADFSNYIFLFLIPIAAGTGILTSARAGTFDLLFGAGVTRTRLWWNALAHALAVPIFLAILIFAVNVPQRALIGTLLRLLSTLLFTGGVGFAVGLVETRYFVGVIWLLFRFIFIISPAGLRTLVRLSKGIEVPSHDALALIIAAAPENLLEPHVPAIYVSACGVVGIIALIASHRWFCAADFGGKRS